MTYSAGVGIANFPFEDARGFWKWVDLCEAGGVDSIWQSDRYVGGDPNLECMSVMAALAGATKRLKFGMNVASMGLRDPFLTAKACATIDVLSDGRLLPAFGVGSSLGRDYSATGVPTKARGRRTDEGLEILSRLWSQDSVTFLGRYYQLDDASISPRPIQQPLPMWVGGSAPQAIERTARWGTGWQAGVDSADQVAPVIKAIKEATVRYQRSIDEDHFGAGFGFRFGNPQEGATKAYIEALTRRLGRKPDKFLAIGDEHAVMRRIHQFIESGVHKFILRPIGRDTDEMIHQTKLLIEKVLPKVAALNR